MWLKQRSHCTRNRSLSVVVRLPTTTYITVVIRTQVKYRRHFTLTVACNVQHCTSKTCKSTRTRSVCKIRFGFKKRIGFHSKCNVPNIDPAYRFVVVVVVVVVVVGGGGSSSIVVVVVVVVVVIVVVVVVERILNASMH